MLPNIIPLTRPLRPLYSEMLVLLTRLAYNVITWVREVFTLTTCRLKSFGPLRMLRDLFHVSGTIEMTNQGKLLRIMLNEAHQLALLLVDAFSSHMARDRTPLNLGRI